MSNGGYSRVGSNGVGRKDVRARGNALAESLNANLENSDQGYVSGDAESNSRFNSQHNATESDSQQQEESFVFEGRQNSEPENRVNPKPHKQGYLSSTEKLHSRELAKTLLHRNQTDYYFQKPQPQKNIRPKALTSKAHPKKPKQASPEASNSYRFGCRITCLKIIKEDIVLCFEDGGVSIFNLESAMANPGGPTNELKLVCSGRKYCEAITSIGTSLALNTYTGQWSEKLITAYLNSTHSLVVWTLDS